MDHQYVSLRTKCSQIEQELSEIENKKIKKEEEFAELKTQMSRIRRNKRRQLDYQLKKIMLSNMHLPEKNEIVNSYLAEFSSMYSS